MPVSLKGAGHWLAAGSATCPFWGVELECASRDLRVRGTVVAVKLRFELADFECSRLRRLLEAHLQDTYRATPSESVHTLSWAALQEADVSLWSMHADHDVVGCGALRELRPDAGELKSMRVEASFRGYGLGSKLLSFLEGRANERGYARIYLETGPEVFYAPARRMYERFGYVECAPFGDYKQDPHSVYMTKELRAR